jgi:hypothetical protein
MRAARANAALPPTGSAETALPLSCATQYGSGVARWIQGKKKPDRNDPA